MGRNEYGIFWSLAYFCSFQALNGAFEVQLTLIACRDMQLRFFFYVKTLLNNAFNKDELFLPSKDQNILVTSHGIFLFIKTSHQY